MSPAGADRRAAADGEIGTDKKTSHKAQRIAAVRDFSGAGFPDGGPPTLHGVNWATLNAPSSSPMIDIQSSCGTQITKPVLRQAGAIVYQVSQEGIKVLLVTSRETKRWIIPRGNIAPGRTPPQTALDEAYEEAGVRGAVEGSAPFGSYTHVKKLQSGRLRGASVEVYLLRLEGQSKRWPERHQRRLAWVSTAEAIDMVEEPGVVPLLRRLCEVEADLLGSTMNAHPGPRRRRAAGR